MPTSADLDAIVEGQTVPSLFAETVARIGDRVALRWREGEGWGEWTFSELADLACRAAAGMAAAGVGRGDRVVLMVRNVPQFHVLDLAAMLCGATAVSIYNSSSADQVSYLVGHCGATFGMVEDAGFFERFDRAALPALEDPRRGPPRRAPTPTSPGTSWSPTTRSTWPRRRPSPSPRTCSPSSTRRAPPARPRA